MGRSLVDADGCCHECGNQSSSQKTPGMDGLEMAGQIRARPDGSRIPLIAFGREEIIERNRQRTEALFDDHLDSPLVDLGLLHEKIQALPGEAG